MSDTDFDAASTIRSCVILDEFFRANRFERALAALPEGTVLTNSNPSLYGTQPGDFSEAEPIAVTDEMVAAGYAADRALPGQLPSERDYFQTIYRAMAAAEPLVPNLPERLIAERDAALARAEKAEKDRDGWMIEWEREHKFQQSLWLPKVKELERRLAAEGDAVEPSNDVDRVIDQLDRRIIGAPERTKLRGALDKADAPDKSRTGQDAAVGRALRLK